MRRVHLAVVARPDMAILLSPQEPPAVVRFGELLRHTPGSQTARAWSEMHKVHGPTPARKGKPQRDRRGKPYEQHTVSVARLALTDWNRNALVRTELADLGFTADDIAAILLLHDVLEESKDPERTKASLYEAGIFEYNIHAVERLSYFKSHKDLPRDLQVREHALQIASSPIGKLLKPYDLAHNLMAKRLYPYLSAADTVHSIWKYLNFCELAGIKPFGMEAGIVVPRIVAILPILLDDDGAPVALVGDMLDSKDYRLHHPPREDALLMSDLRDEEKYPIRSLRGADWDLQPGLFLT